ncbi:MAG: ABC transporter substrate-binding protein [Chloroflexi bacterium]|nr:ABC transporter substrate-binding protein [Chloroflexota bacterium]
MTLTPSCPPTFVAQTPLAATSRSSKCKWPAKTSNTAFAWASYRSTWMATPAYDITEEQRTALLKSGQWDCLLTTLDSVALKSPGVITAIVDESAGADQLWGRDVDTINDIQGKRIAFAQDSVGEYFVYYVLSIAQLSPRSQVTLVPQDSVADAMAIFNSGQADVVSGWEPDIYEAETSGGQSLLSSNQLRIVMDVIVTSQNSIQNEADLVQNFHNAWFDTLKAQTADFDTAAAQIGPPGAIMIGALSMRKRPPTTSTPG